jgi:hypothetical protein
MMVPAVMPRSVEMARVLNSLREQAAQIRRQTVRSNGQVSGHSIEELLAELRRFGSA